MIRVGQSAVVYLIGRRNTKLGPVHDDRYIAYSAMQSFERHYGTVYNFQPNSIVRVVKVKSFHERLLIQIRKRLKL